MTLPETMIRVLDGTVAVRARGDGPPIVFVHGNSCSSRSFAKQLSSELADEYRLFAIDLPGHGDSAPAAVPEQTCNLPGYAGVLVRALEELGALDALFVGWSLGGHILLEAAPQLPRASGLFVYGTPPVATAEEFASACFPEPAMGALFRDRSTEAEIDELLALFVRPGTSVPSVFLEDFVRTDGRARAAQAASTAGLLDERRIVGELRAPLAVAHGVGDRLIRRSYFDDVPMPTLWRGAVQEIPDAGHAPHWENPEVFNRLLRDFARDCGLRR